MIIDLLLLLYGSVLLASLAITLYNYFAAPRISPYSEKLTHSPKISVLIYARDAGKFINSCFRSLLAQNYDNFEIVIYDDNSSDNTQELLESYVLKNNRITLLNSTSHPDGWTNKNWANGQLADHATGDLLLFMDVKVLLKENSLSAAVEKMQRNNCEVLSVLPTLKIKSPAEFLIAPILEWLLLSFIPLKMFNKSANNFYAVSSSPFIMFKKDVYYSVGGFETVKNSSSGFINIIRLINLNGLKQVTALGGNSIFTRGSEGFGTMLSELSFSIAALFNYKRGKVLFYTTIVQSAYLLPIILSFFDYNFLWLVFGIILNRFVYSFTSRQSPHIGILHPFQMLILVLVTFRSSMADRKR